LLAAGPAHAQAPLENVILANPVISLSFSMGYIAEDLGIWAKHGLAVKTIEISGVGALNAVISGSADFAQPSGLSFTRAVAKGQKLIAIAASTNRITPQLVMRKELVDASFDPKAPLAQRAQILKGRIIAVDAVNTVIHAYVRLLAKRGGYDPEEIRVAMMQPPNMIAALAAKSIDGFAMAPPWTLKPVLEGTATMIASGPDGDPSDLDPFATVILVTKSETCEKRAELCRKMGQAMTEAGAFLLDHPAESLAILKKRFATLDDKLLTASYELLRKMTPRPPILPEKSLENDDLFNIEAGLMSADDKLKSYDGLVTDKYVR
jgi:ABC-type nitrate/sulfonate/bicarbonate transport system substrate-binding protein